MEISTQEKTNSFSENNNITLNETECRGSPVQDANKSNHSDNESHKYSSTSSKKLKVSLDSYQNQSMNILMELGILKSVVERVGTCPECSSRLRIKLLSEEHQDFSNMLNILCEQCTRTDEFYSSSVISPKAICVGKDHLV